MRRLQNKRLLLASFWLMPLLVGPGPFPCQAQVMMALPAAPAVTEPSNPQTDPSGPPRNLKVPVLQLGSGDFVAGDLKASPQNGILRWQAESFAGSFDFPLNAVAAIHWPLHPSIEKPQGEMAFELVGGDVVSGDLAGLNDREITIRSPRAGQFTIDRGSVSRFVRYQADVQRVYMGPNGLSGWKELGVTRPDEHGWREEAGQILTEKAGASIQTDVALPERAVVEFEISWTKKPNFLIAIGTGDNPALAKQAFRFEIWEKQLVLSREIDRKADLTVLQEVGDNARRLKLTVYLDQDQGLMAVFSREGQQLGQLQLKGAGASRLGKGVLFQCLTGDLRVKWLQVSRWIGDLPHELKSDQARVLKLHGESAYGEVTGYDAAKRELIFKQKQPGGDWETRIPLAELAQVSLAPRQRSVPGEARVVYHDGTCISGEFVTVREHAIELKPAGVKHPLSLPRAGIQSLLVLKHDEKKTIKSEGVGRLELQAVVLHGKLIDGAEGPGTTCFSWQPVASKTSAALRAGVSGKIVYRDPPPPAQNPNGLNVVAGAVGVVAQPQPGVGGLIFKFAQALGGPPPAAKSAAPQRRPERKALFLRDGDVIPAVIESVDQKGVTFSSSISSRTFVPHEKLKAIELVPMPPAPLIRLTRAKRDRLLTLPRLQKPDPPTQLIRSTNGDYVRARVLKLDDKALEAEIHLETRRIPRERVAQIIWLHPEDLPSDKPDATIGAKPTQTKPAPAPAQPARRGALIQAVRHDGVRITFHASQVASEQIKGASEILGDCQVATSSIDLLLIEDAIKQNLGSVPYQRWKLVNAIEPKFVNASESGGESAGADSPLVNRPAPDFTLDLLDGQKFHLADSRGKIVMLDFWATWCGPCIQAMPQVETVAREFEKDGVTLVAVNLQETPEQIKAMLERHKLRVKVALDREGIVAEKYKAVAIPQTVIIGKDGKVARMFVGGGAHFGDRLRQALEAVLADERVKKPAAGAGKAAADANKPGAGSRAL